jgi:ATP-dependent DNA ligase
MFIVFDLVFLNGVSLCDRPLEERLRILATLFEPIPGRLVVSEHWVHVISDIFLVFLILVQRVSTVEEFLMHANRAIDNCEEGVVLKKMDSKYVPDGRAGQGWFKWKPDYVADVVSDLDLLVVGGYYGCVYEM